MNTQPRPVKRACIASRSLAALAAVVWSNSAGAQAVVDRFVTPIDLNADGRTDFLTIRTTVTEYMPWGQQVQTVTWTLQNADVEGYTLLAPPWSLLNSGARIGSESPAATAWRQGELTLLGVVVAPGGGSGGLLMGGPGFIGVRFAAKEAEHFGWLRYDYGYLWVALSEAAFQPTASKAIAAGEVPLSIRPAGRDAVISWSPFVTNLTLRASRSLESPTWIGVGEVVGNAVTIPAADAARFFRLEPREW